MKASGPEDWGDFQTWWQSTTMIEDVHMFEVNLTVNLSKYVYTNNSRPNLSIW
jgi:hypothetical protein